MLDLRQYPSLGAALRDALEHWPNETCLIEADRDKEKTRLTYSDFKELARPLTRALQDADFREGDRAAIIMHLCKAIGRPAAFTGRVASLTSRININRCCGGLRTMCNAI